MKKIILMVLLSPFSHHLMAQTYDEWFRQKKTKLQYITQQIAAFEMYAGNLKKGYEIADKGWNAINDIKHGDFNLHNTYFNSLKQVNSSVADYDKIDNITIIQLQILQVDNATKKLVVNNKNIQPYERDYISKVMANLLDKCTGDLDEMKLLTTNDSLSMKDDERLKRIDKLYMDMQDKYSFAKYFQSSVQTLVLSRAKETNDINTSKLLYGIK